MGYYAQTYEGTIIAIFLAKSVAFCTDFINFAKEKSRIEAFSDSQAWLAQW